MTQTELQSGAYATLGQIADYLVHAADDYHKCDRSALLDGTVQRGRVISHFQV